MFAEIPIGTAAPTKAETDKVKHYFIGNLRLEDYYSAALYEEQAISLLDTLFAKHEVIIATGGSMMYIDALCYGIDRLPTVSKSIRNRIMERYRNEGLESMVSELKRLDPVYYDQVDLRNFRRVLHALEICHMTGRPYSELRTGRRAERPFNIIKIGLTRPREELYARINRRVDQMIEKGLIDEARRVYPKKGLNSLNTVGYKELFKWMDGALTHDGEPCTLEFAIEKIKQNTRIYSRKQMTWFKRDPETRWFNPDDVSGITDYIKDKAL